MRIGGIFCCILIYSIMKINKIMDRFTHTRRRQYNESLINILYIQELSLFLIDKVSRSHARQRIGITIGDRQIHRCQYVCNLCPLRSNILRSMKVSNVYEINKTRYNVKDVFIEKNQTYIYTKLRRYYLIFDRKYQVF